MAPYAGFWLRVVAYLIDSVILTIAFGAVIGILVASFGVRFFRGFIPGIYNQPTVSYEPSYPIHPFFPAAALGIFLVLLPITIVVTWLYFALMEASVRQGTLGKIALGLFVTDLQGRRISFARATGRFFAKIITGLVPLFHRLHHGGVYAEEAGIARHDRRLPGTEENLSGYTPQP